MKFNTVTQTLLHENPNALQFLHYASGFDFNSPFHVSSGTGRFTFNKVMAQVSSVIKGPVNVALFVKVNNHYLPRLYYVPMGNSGFKPTESGLRNTYYYNVDDFNTQRRFEEVRKNETDHYYIVIQSKSYSKPWHEKQFDYDARYKIERHTLAQVGYNHVCLGSLVLTRKSDGETFSFAQTSSFTRMNSMPLVKTLSVTWTSLAIMLFHIAMSYMSVCVTIKRTMLASLSYNPTSRPHCTTLIPKRKRSNKHLSPQPMPCRPMRIAAKWNEPPTTLAVCSTVLIPFAARSTKKRTGLWTAFSMTLNISPRTIRMP